MKKIVAVAALVAATFVAPALPTQAATMMEEMDENCLIFPMFKQECWDQARHYVAERRAAAEDWWSGAADVTPPQSPVEWWNCTRAPEGSGHLLDC